MNSTETKPSSGDLFSQSIKRVYPVHKASAYEGYVGSGKEPGIKVGRGRTRKGIEIEGVELLKSFIRLLFLY